jgi:hypothetical protein
MLTQEDEGFSASLGHIARFCVKKKRKEKKKPWLEA